MNKPDVKHILASNLRRLMDKNKHSQSYVHKKTGISQSTVGRILNKDVSATIDSLESIAHLYGLFTWQLIVPDIDVTNPPMLKVTTQTEKEFYEKMKALIKEFQ